MFLVGNDEFHLLWNSLCEQLLIFQDLVTWRFQVKKAHYTFFAIRSFAHRLCTQRHTKQESKEFLDCLNTLSLAFSLYSVECKSYLLYCCYSNENITSFESQDIMYMHVCIYPPWRILSKLSRRRSLFLTLPQRTTAKTTFQHTFLSVGAFEELLHENQTEQNNLIAIINLFKSRIYCRAFCVHLKFWLRVWWYVANHNIIHPGIDKAGMGFL